MFVVLSLGVIMSFISRMSQIPVNSLLVVSVRAPYITLLCAGVAWPAHFDVCGRLLWVACLADLFLSGCDAAAAVNMPNGHDVHVASGRGRLWGALDYLGITAVTTLAWFVLPAWESSQVALLLCAGWYVRFSSWWWWYKSDEEVGGSAPSAGCDDCGCCAGMPLEDAKASGIVGFNIRQPDGSVRVHQTLPKCEGYCPDCDVAPITHQAETESVFPAGSPAARCAGPCTDFEVRGQKIDVRT
jgi:hypothetical protein